MRRIKKTIKKYPKKLVVSIMLLVMVFSCIAPLSKVIAASYGEGDKYITMGFQNKEGFTISAKVNNATWNSDKDEFHSKDNKYHIEIIISGNDTTGDKVPNLIWGGNWNGEDGKITNSTHKVDGGYQFVLDLTVTSAQTFLGLTVEEKQNGSEGVEPGPEPGESYFDGKAYVVWSCGTGICYHYFDDIPNFDNGNSTFYKDTEITADNKEGVTFDVKAKYIGWYLADEFTEWQRLYKIATGNEVNWNTLDPEIILGEPNQHIDELEKAAINANACEKPDEDAPRDEKDAFERCINEYAAEHDHDIWTHQLQPVGEPTYNNVHVSYGDRNFKVAIYNSNYKGVTMGDLSKLNYYPAEWTNPFIKRDHFDLSGSTESKPAQLNSILLESTVRIKALDYNDFEIASIEPLDVPADAVKISKEKDEFIIEYSSNFYDNVKFKVTDTKGEVTYMQIKRYTIDGWIRNDEKNPLLIADFYFDNKKSYQDFNLTAKIIYKDGTSKNVTLEASYGIDDGLGNITEAYEIDESDPKFGEGGKGLKRSVFTYSLETGEADNIQDIYLNAEYKGSTADNYAGAYVGSGEGVLANIYHGEEE